MIKLSKIDSDILFLLWKFYAMQVEQLSVILGVDAAKVARRVRALRERGLVDNALILGGNAKALVYLKKRGMRALGELSEYDWIPEVERREYTKSAMLAQHVLGEAMIAAWLALPADAKSIKAPSVPASFVLTERDARSVAFTTGEKTPKYVDKGLHLPDAWVRFSPKHGEPWVAAIEYERTLKPKSARRQLSHNARINAQRFKKQYWFVNGRTASEVNKVANDHPEYNIVLIDMATVERDLARYSGGVSLLGAGKVKAQPLRDLPVRFGDQLKTADADTAKKVAEKTQDTAANDDALSRLGLNTKR